MELKEAKQQVNPWFGGVSHFIPYRKGSKYWYFSLVYHFCQYKSFWLLSRLKILLKLNLTFICKERFRKEKLSPKYLRRREKLVLSSRITHFFPFMSYDLWLYIFCSSGNCLLCYTEAVYIVSMHYCAWNWSKSLWWVFKPILALLQALSA